MRKKTAFLIIPLLWALAAFSFFCAKDSLKKDVPADTGDISLHDLDIDKKYLAEGFMSADLYRVVIISPKEAGPPDLDLIRAKAKKRALVSLERSLAADGVTCDRNTRAGILGLVQDSGELERQDIEHRRYDVYYYDITKTHMKSYLKNMSAER